MTHKVIYNPHVHTACYFSSVGLRAGRANGANSDGRFSLEGVNLELPKIACDETAKNKVWDILKAVNAEIDETKKIVVVNPNASKLFAMRKWPLENYASLIGMLLEDGDIYVAIITRSKV